MIPIGKSQIPNSKSQANVNSQAFKHGGASYDEFWFLEFDEPGSWDLEFPDVHVITT
jgi:hypothetical protein